jgi:hypothetical protein
MGGVRDGSEPTGGALCLITTSRILHSRVNQNENGCWIIGDINIRDKYKKIVINGKTYKSSILSAVLFLGLQLDENNNVPKGIQVCHFCQWKACCNPKHLYIGNNGTNRKDLQYDKIVNCIERGHEIKRRNYGSLYCGTCADSAKLKRGERIRGIWNENRKLLKLA